MVNHMVNHVVTIMSALAITYGPLLVWAAGFYAWVAYLVDTAERREAGTSFVLDFIPFTSDVAATDATLPPFGRTNT